MGELRPGRKKPPRKKQDWFKKPIGKGLPQPVTFKAPGGGTSIRHPPKRYTPEMGREICRQIMEGRTLKKICEDPRMPSKRAIMYWLSDPARADFRELYYYSRRVYSEILVDEIVTIADDTSNDWKEKKDRHGNFLKMVPDNEAIQRSRLKIDTRKWLAAKLMPRIYGENKVMQHDVTGDLKKLMDQAANRDKGLPNKTDD